MHLSVKLRLAVMTSAVALMGLMIVWATLYSQRKANEIRVRLGNVDSESFGIAEHFGETFRNLNGILFRCGLRRNSADWEQFRKVSAELNQWIDKQSPKLRTQREKDVLRQIDYAYDDYLKAARNVQARVQSLGQQELTLAEVTDLLGESQRLFDLGQTLAKAHHESRNLVLSRANQTLVELRQLVVGLICLLFAFGVALAAGVYRDMIAPLRVKLVESQAVAERQEKLASLGMLAAGVAHEIRNPLTAIKAALFIQQKKFRPGSEEQADSKVVEREILRLERIVSDILEFARPAEPDLATVPADLPLREVQDFIAPQLAAANIKLVREESAPMWIRVDLAQIKQVLINLVKNAVESMDRGGTVTLRTRHETKSLNNGKTDVVILEVADTGAGIPPEVEKRLFDPFFTTKDQGTGLGLSIAVRILQKHGGALQYQTQVQRGTTFGIVLPRVTS